MRVLITGITGRIGANLAAALTGQGHNIRGLVWPRDPRVEKLQPLDLELQTGTITEPEDVRKAMEGVEAVYHLGAAFQGGGPFTEAEYFEINVRGTFNMLEAAKAEGGIGRFVFASTDAVLHPSVWGGPQEQIRVDESPRGPSDWYSLSKSMGEELCNGYVRMGAVPVTILRFPYTFGAGEIVDFGNFYLSKSWESYGLDAWDGEERLVLLKDEQGRPFKKHVADVRDVVGGCVAAFDREQAAGDTIQLAGPGAFTWDVAVPHLSERIGMPYVEATATQGPPSFYEHDMTKARDVLGWEPRYDIVTMIDDALAFRRGEDIGVLPV
jgi:UDP-glucose 4-epimerase